MPDYSDLPPGAKPVYDDLPQGATPIYDDLPSDASILSVPTPTTQAVANPFQRPVPDVMRPMSVNSVQSQANAGVARPRAWGETTQSEAEAGLGAAVPPTTEAGETLPGIATIGHGLLDLAHAFIQTPAETIARANILQAKAQRAFNEKIFKNLPEAPASQATKKMWEGVQGKMQNTVQSNEDMWRDVLKYNKAAYDTIEKGLVKAGASLDDPAVKISKFLGSTAGTIMKYAVMGPAADAGMTSEAFTDKLYQGIDEGKSPLRSILGGTASAATAAAVLATPGGKKAVDSVWKLIAAKALRGFSFGSAFGLSDAAIDKFIYDKKVTPKELGSRILSSVENILGLELAGVPAGVREIRDARAEAGRYDSAAAGRAEIIPDLADKLAQFADLGRAENPNAALASPEGKALRDDIEGLRARSRAITYAEKAKIPFTGQRKPQEVSNAREIESPVTVGEQPSRAQGPGGEGRQGVGQGVQGAEATGARSPEEKAQEETPQEVKPQIPVENPLFPEMLGGKTLAKRGEEPPEGVGTINPDQAQAALQGPAWHELPKDRQDEIHKSILESSRNLAENPQKTIENYRALPETKDGRIVGGDFLNLLHPAYVENANHALGAMGEGDVEVLTNNAIAFKHIRDAAIDRAAEEGKDGAIMLGGQGNGKTTVSSKLIDNNPDGIGVVLDTPNNDPQGLEADVRRMRERGIPVHVVYVDRDPADAFRSTILRTGSDVRHVNPDTWVDHQYRAPKAAEHVGEVFRNDPNVSLVHYTKDGPIGGPLDAEGKDAILSLRNRKHYSKPDLDDIARRIYLEEREAGNVPEAIAKSIEFTTPRLAGNAGIKGSVPSVGPRLSGKTESTASEAPGGTEKGSAEEVVSALRPVEGKPASAPEEVATEGARAAQPAKITPDEAAGATRNPFQKKKAAASTKGKKLTPKQETPSRDAVIKALRDAKDPNMGGLVDVPQAVKTLVGDGYKVEDIHSVLADLGKDRIFVGRPQAPSETDYRSYDPRSADWKKGERAALSPKGLSGTVLPLAELHEPASTEQAKVPVPMKLGEPAKDKAQAEGIVRQIVLDKAVRAAIHATGISGENPTPEDVVDAALFAQPKPKTPFEKPGPESGMIRLPEKINIGGVLTRFANRIKMTAKALGGETGQAFRNIRNGGILRLAKALDAEGKLQHDYDPATQAVPRFSDALFEGSAKPKPIKDMDVGEVGQYFRSPFFQTKGLFKPGEAPSVDREMVTVDAIAKINAGVHFVKDVFKRNDIRDHSDMIDRRMKPHQKAILDVVTKLTPLVKTREAFLNALDNFETEQSRDEVQKRLDEFDRENQADMEKLVQEKERLYTGANNEIRSLAKGSPDVRVALWMETEKRPVWLEPLMKPNEIKAAKELTTYMEESKRAGEDRGLKMRDEAYITHLFKPTDIYAYDSTSEGAQLARDILDFHHRQENSINLMPSAHAAMSYYVPTISRKLAMQPFLNKWYKGGKNDYLDPNSPFYAPNFGQWLQREITEMQYPRRISVAENGVDIVKQAEITKLLALNQRTAIKHVVGKLTNLVGLHHAYMLPGAANYMVLMARKAENLPLVGRAFETTTGKVLDKMNMSKDDAKLVQTLMSNLALNKQIRNTLYENPLIAQYQESILNANFGPSVRGFARSVKNKAVWVRNALGQPITAVEAFENGVNFLSSAQQGEAAKLTPDQNLRGAIVNMLAYSQRGGHDASRFVKSPEGRIGTALTQTPSKMIELYADILRRGITGEKDIYGSDGTANMVRAIAAIGIVSYLGSRKGHKLYKMLLHPPLLNMTWAENLVQYGYFSAVGKDREALLAKARMQGSSFGAITTTPVGDILNDIYTAVGSPKAFAKSIPAVQQIRSELPENLGGKVPRGYTDTSHYLTTSPTPEAEKAWEKLGERKGLQKMRQDARKAAQ